jgi:DNA end-binding protein Ku
MPAVVWKGFVSFGMVSFPVRLYSAARAEAVHFHMLHRPDLSRVKEVWYCGKENKPIERSEIIKGYETAAGKYVVVEDEELKEVAPATATTMEVVQFVSNDEVDPIWLERSYYVGADDKIAKPYVLFFRALKDTSHSAIAKLTMHGRENIVLIRAGEDGMILHTLYYADEIHKAKQPRAPAKAAGSARELELAKQLIKQLSGPFKPEAFHDVYRQNVEKMIKQKQKGQNISRVEQPKRAQVIDLMEALQQSLKKSGSRKSEAPIKKTARRRQVA